MSPFRTGKAPWSPLDDQLAALRRTYEQIPADQQPTFLGRLDEVCRAWTGQLTAEAAEPRRTPDARALFSPSSLPAGQPIPWEDLVPYEREQCGYWLYGTDPYGKDKRWVRVKRPAEEVTHGDRS